MEAGLTRQFQSQKLTDLAKALVSKKKIGGGGITEDTKPGKKFICFV